MTLDGAKERRNNRQVVFYVTCGDGRQSNWGNDTIDDQKEAFLVRNLEGCFAFRWRCALLSRISGDACGVSSSNLLETSGLDGKVEGVAIATSGFEIR
jgi:hypothetical protein